MAKQLAVSSLSFITLPLFRERLDGVKVFFRKNYTIAPDGLIFDGSTNGYFDKLERVYDLSKLRGRIVCDIGCGEGTFMGWLLDKPCEFTRYIGIDFALQSKASTPKAEFILDDAVNWRKHIPEGISCTIVFVNSACYLNDDTLKAILSGLRPMDEVIIADPAFNLFWDAHFQGVKPIYRGIKSMENLLESCQLQIANEVQDYMFIRGGCYCFPVSYAVVAVKR